MTYGQNMRLVVLPQAFRNMIPVFMTQTIILFQDTSLVYAIGAYDLLKGFEIAGADLASLDLGITDLQPDDVLNVTFKTNEAPYVVLSSDQKCNYGILYL